MEDHKIKVLIFSHIVFNYSLSDKLITHIYFSICFALYTGLILLIIYKYLIALYVMFFMLTANNNTSKQIINDHFEAKI